jgi:glyoxalase family protein
VLTEALGFRAEGHEDHVVRFRAGGGDDSLGTVVDVRTARGFLAGRQGTGSVHHVAFRAATDAAQGEMVATLRARGLRPTDQMDRSYFRSVYFREPGGVLFEIATDDPGFTVDEPKETLGTTVKLPPWLEARRDEIVAALPPLS